MVNQHPILGTSAALIAQSEVSGFERLDPVTRTVVLMALLGLVLLGITLIACVMIGGHWVRRLARHSPTSRARSKLSLRSTPSKVATDGPHAPTSDTLAAAKYTDETRTD